MSDRSYLKAEDPAVDLAVAEAMAAELEEYLVADELYRTLIIRMPTGDQNVQMTLGDLLSRLRRLRGEEQQLSQGQRSRLDAVSGQVETTFRSLRTRMIERMGREMKSRIDSLRWFLDECASDSRRCRIEFPFEMRHRQRIEELVRAADGKMPGDLTKALQGIDHRLSRMTQASEFIWDERLKSTFPQDPYWYLYVMPIV
jgi:hypothetical protein